MGARLARLPVKCSLILLEDLSVLWVVIGCHQVTLLHVSTHIVSFVEVRLLRCGGILVVRADFATLNSFSMRRVHSMALNSGSLLLLDQGCRALRLTESYRIVRGAPKVDTGHVLRIKVLRVRPDHSVQVSIHGLLCRASPLRSGGCVWTHETFYISAASGNSSRRVAQVNQLSLLVEIFALFACSAIDLAFPKHVSVLLQAALASLDFELRIYVTPTEIVRIVRD